VSRRRWLRWLVIAAVIVQLALPLAALAGPRPSRFGWQMFTAMAPIPVVWTEFADGDLSAVDLDTLLIHPRSEADLRPALVAALCTDDDVRAVLVETIEGRSRTSC
jgi:energy-converting hydrogenase Eha subunit A